MPPVRGRPVNHNYNKMDEAIIRRKSEVLDHGKIVSKSMAVWKTISEEVNVGPSGLYSYVTCNRNSIKDRLLGSEFASESVFNLTDKVNSSAMSVSIESIEEDSGVRIVDLHLSRAEFTALLETKSYARTKKKRTNQIRRQYTVLKPGQWQETITKKL